MYQDWQRMYQNRRYDALRSYSHMNNVVVNMLRIKDENKEDAYWERLFSAFPNAKAVKNRIPLTRLLYNDMAPQIINCPSAVKN